MSTKKRKQTSVESEQGGSYSQFGSPTTPDSRKRKNTKRPVSTEDKAFLDKKNAQYVYESKLVNDHFIKLYRKAIAEDNKADDGKNEDRPFLMTDISAEHQRYLTAVNELYGRESGDLMAMGQDDTFQLGIHSMKRGDDDMDKQPVYPPSVVHVGVCKWIQAAAGGMHSVALTNDGKVYTWGCSDDGALGRLPDNEEEGFTDVDGSNPRMVSGFRSFGSNNLGGAEDSGIVMIDAGDSHSLMLSIEGNVYMTGMFKDMDSGKFANLRHPSDPTIDYWKAPISEDQDGNPEPPPPRPPQIKLSRTTPCHVHEIKKKVNYISCGQSFNAAILEDNTLVTWGMGHQGELARSADMTKPDAGGKFDLGQNLVKDMKTGKYHLDLVRDKFLKPMPPRWADGPHVKKIVTNVACGGFHLLVAARDDSSGSSISQLYTSGLNNYGQLGHGDLENRHELTLVESLKDENIWRMAGGEHHSVVCNAAGTLLYAFGRSDYGQLGLFEEQQNTGECVKTPTIVKFPIKKKSSTSGDNDDDSVPRIFDLDCGDRHTMVITSISNSNQVYSWGFGEMGTTGHYNKLGEINGQIEVDDKDINRPKKVSILQYCRTGTKNTRAINVSGGGQHSLMIVKRYGAAAP